MADTPGTPGTVNDYADVSPTCVDVEMGQNESGNSSLGSRSSADENDEEYDNKCCCGLIERESLGSCSEAGEHICGRAMVAWVSIVVVIIVVVLVV